MYKTIALVLCFGLALILKLTHVAEIRNVSMLITLSLGLIIIFAKNIGDIFEKIHLPRITGYMITGILFGSYVIGFIPKKIASDLRYIDTLALSVIAFTAGGELKLGNIRRNFKAINVITLCIIFVDFFVVSLFVFTISSILPAFFPFISNWSLSLRVTISLLFGALSLAKSPLTTIAVIEETGIKNTFVDKILGIVILKDVFFLILFSFIISVAKTVFSPLQTVDWVLFGKIAIEIFGSFGVGAIFGILIALYLKFIKHEPVMFLLATAFLVTTISKAIHLEPLLVAMTAGFIVENFTKQGDAFMSSLGKGKSIVYIVFFAINGATLNLGELQNTWFIAVVILVVRQLSTFGGLAFGSLIADKKDKTLRRYGWTAFINQSGVTLAAAIIIEKSFPGIGNSIKSIAIAMIAITDFIGPAMFKLSLRKTVNAYKDDEARIT